MSEKQENSIGKSQHPQILQAFGGEYDDPKLQAYVRELGNRVAKDTERPNVKYTFSLLDTPILNAFAVPGGYIYVTRGLVATANSEAELAGVLAHEVGHITGRHSAERYSRDLLTAIGTTAAASVIGSAGVGRALGVGANLFSKSYSRGQEHQADELGVRYLHKAGYDTQAMSSFLAQLEADSNLQSKLTGANRQARNDFFSTHPNTAGRVVAASDFAKKYPKNSNQVGRNRHLSMINGIMYGDSEKHGFTRGQNFYHPDLGFMFTTPKGYKITNQPSQVLVTSNRGAAMVLDIRNKEPHQTPRSYIADTWLKDQVFDNPIDIKVNGMRAATTSFNGTINGSEVGIRVVAIEYGPQKVFRFQIAIPKNSSTATVNDLKKSSYSFRRMTSHEKKTIKSQRLRVITAKTGDTVKGLANRMDFKDFKVERFRALNGLKANDKIISGRKYKIVTSG